MIVSKRQLEKWFGFLFSIRFFWKALKFSFWFVLAGTLAISALLWMSADSVNQTGLIQYEWVLCLFLFFLSAFFLPYLLKWLFFSLEPQASFFKKRVMLSFAASVLPILMGCFILTVMLFLPGKITISTMGLFLCWVIGVLLLTIWSIWFAVKISSDKTIDSMRLIFNGMEMVSKLDFDHLIVSSQQDEIGDVSGQFNRMTQLLKTRVGILQALFDNIRIFSGMLKKEKIIDHSIQSFKSLEEAGEIVIALWDEEVGQMTVERSSGNRADTVGLQFSAGEGVLGQMIQSPQFLAWSPDEYDQMAKGSEKERLLWGKPTYVVCTPMLFKGILKGAVILYDLDLEKFATDRKMDYLQGLANQIAIFLENARLYRMVIQDRLTGLFVHSFIEGELENLLAQAKRYKFPVSFVMFDVDKFKQINDQYGHTAGNNLLRAVSQAIRAVSRDADSPGRYGGDEFEIILPHTDKDGALVYAEKLRAGVSNLEVEVGAGIKAKVTISVGLATYPHDAKDSEALQAAADSALYAAKAKGRNCVVVYAEK